MPHVKVQVDRQRHIQYSARISNMVGDMHRHWFGICSLMWMGVVTSWIWQVWDVGARACIPLRVVAAEHVLLPLMLQHLLQHWLQHLLQHLLP